ncbi:MAG: hypothetical protein ACPF8V_08020, partial [Luteibaculum sp.]
APFSLTYIDSTGQKQASNLNAEDSILFNAQQWGNIRLIRFSDSNLPSCSRNLNLVLNTQEVKAPTLNLTVDPEIICEGEKIAYKLNFTGVAPFNYKLAINGTEISQISPTA